MKRFIAAILASTFASIAYAGGLAGVIDAGDSWLIWVNLGDTTTPSTLLNVTEGDTLGETGITILRSGLQAGGIFP